MQKAKTVLAKQARIMLNRTADKENEIKTLIKRI
jgi:hypothetical protein